MTLARDASTIFKAIVWLIWDPRAAHPAQLTIWHTSAAHFKKQPLWRLCNKRRCQGTWAARQHVLPLRTGGLLNKEQFKQEYLYSWHHSRTADCCLLWTGGCSAGWRDIVTMVSYHDMTVVPVMVRAQHICTDKAVWQPVRWEYFGHLSHFHSRIVHYS